MLSISEAKPTNENLSGFFAFVCFSTVIYAVDHKSTSRLALLLVCGGVALLVIVVVAVLCFVRYRSGWYAVEKKRRKAEKVERARAEQLEMEVEQPGNDSTDDPTVSLLACLLQ